MEATVFECFVAIAAWYMARRIGNGTETVPVTKLHSEMTDCIK